MKFIEMKDIFRKNFHHVLLSWYDTHRREMPWRRTYDPYHIWISEVMLQQTQVNTAIAYYSRFIQRFPTVQALAEADLSEVMKVWEGLGYYSRARNLHKAAEEIMRRFQGKIPDQSQALLSLPGIGRYTAGAILSIAFDKQCPILDGNVIRVLARIFHVTDTIDRASTQKLLWALAEEILPKKRVRDFNQALMELGALLCKPKRPLCVACPVAIFCEAKKLSIQEELPVKSPRKPIPHYDVTGGIIWKEGKFLITLRPPKGLLGGLWEFPGGKKNEGEDLQACLKREIREELAIDIRIDKFLTSVKHAYSHFRITLHVFQCNYVRGAIQLFACSDYRWIPWEELERYAFPAADRKVIRWLKENTRGGKI